MATPKRRKSKKPRKVSDKRLAESRGLYYREVIDGGCVLLQSDYWRLMAQRREEPIVQEQAPPPPVSSDPKDWTLALGRAGLDGL